MDRIMSEMNYPTEFACFNMQEVIKYRNQIFESLLSLPMAPTMARNENGYEFNMLHYCVSYLYQVQQAIELPDYEESPEELEIGPNGLLRVNARLYPLVELIKYLVYTYQTSKYARNPAYSIRASLRIFQHITTYFVDQIFDSHKKTPSPPHTIVYSAGDLFARMMKEIYTFLRNKSKGVTPTTWLEPFITHKTEEEQLIDETMQEEQILISSPSPIVSDRVERSLIYTGERSNRKRKRVEANEPNKSFKYDDSDVIRQLEKAEYKQQQFIKICDQLSVQDSLPDYDEDTTTTYAEYKKNVESVLLDGDDLDITIEELNQLAQHELNKSTSILEMLSSIIQ
jgi:hypothetical protein